MRLSSFILTVTLNPAIDKTIIVPGFKIGGEYREKLLIKSAGGKGINVSRALTALGVASLATGILAGDEGDYIEDELKKENIKNSFVKISGHTRTNLTIIDPLSVSATRLIGTGPRSGSAVRHRFMANYKHLLKNAQYVIFSGANANGFSDGIYRALIIEARKYGVKAVVDTRSGPLAEAVKARPFMVKPNLEEAEYLFGRKLLSIDSVAEASARLVKNGIKIAAITMGERGAVVCDGADTLYARAPAAKAVNTIGCGDAFLAGFIASQKEGMDIYGSARMAVASGAANALSGKPGMIKLKDVRRIFKKAHCRKLA